MQPLLLLLFPLCPENEFLECPYTSLVTHVTTIVVAYSECTYNYFIAGKVSKCSH